MLILCCLSHIRLKKKNKNHTLAVHHTSAAVLLLSFFCPQGSFLSAFTKTLASVEERGTAKSVTVRRPSIRCELVFLNQSKEQAILLRIII